MSDIKIGNDRMGRINENNAAGINDIKSGVKEAARNIDTISSETRDFFFSLKNPEKISEQNNHFDSALFNDASRNFKIPAPSSETLADFDSRKPTSGITENTKSRIKEFSKLIQDKPELLKNMMENSGHASTERREQLEEKIGLVERSVNALELFDKLTSKSAAHFRKAPGSEMP